MKAISFAVAVLLNYTEALKMTTVTPVALAQGFPADDGCIGGDMGEDTATFDSAGASSKKNDGGSSTDGGSSDGGSNNNDGGSSTDDNSNNNDGGSNNNDGGSSDGGSTDNGGDGGTDNGGDGNNDNGGDDNNNDGGDEGGDDVDPDMQEEEDMFMTELLYPPEQPSGDNYRSSSWKCKKKQCYYAASKEPVNGWSYYMY